MPEVSPARERRGPMTPGALGDTVMTRSPRGDTPLQPPQVYGVDRRAGPAGRVTPAGPGSRFRIPVRSPAARG